jgi:hypothetical protein
VTVGRFDNEINIGVDEENRRAYGRDNDTVEERVTVGDIADWEIEKAQHAYMDDVLARKKSRRPEPARKLVQKNGWWHEEKWDNHGGKYLEPVCPIKDAPLPSGNYAKKQPNEFIFSEEVITLPKLIKKENVDMEKVTVNGQLQTYIAVVSYLNTNGREYDFFCNIPLQDQDIVVVDGANGLGLAKVVGIKTQSKMAKSWIVQKVDLTEHYARIQAETRRKELEKQMEERLRKVNKLEQYRKLAENDPEMAAMLEEMEGLTGEKLLPTAKTSLVGAPVLKAVEYWAQIRGFEIMNSEGFPNGRGQLVSEAEFEEGLHKCTIRMLPVQYSAKGLRNDTSNTGYGFTSKN